MLETVAAVPGMVGGMLLHLRSLRKFEQSGGWIKALLEEAENERMHLMTMVELVKPAWYERLLVLTVQGVFFNAFFVLYMISPKLAHRIVGYLEEEAIHSYTEYLKDIDSGKIENVPAPAIAIDYWRLPKDATLKDVITVIRADEAHHRDVNHFASVSIKNLLHFHSLYWLYYYITVSEVLSSIIYKSFQDTSNHCDFIEFEHNVYPNLLVLLMKSVCVYAGYSFSREGIERSPSSRWISLSHIVC